GSTSTLTATITPSNATTNTVTWSSSNTSVATVDSSGKVTGVKAGTATITATSNNGKTATCQVTVSTAVEKVFVDVNASAWYAPYIQYVYDNGLMSGTSDNTFSPNDTLTRAQVVQILYNKEKKPEVTGSMPFQDVKRGTWYYNAILWAYQNNVVAGTTTTTFAPEDKVTREQFAVILHNYEKKPAVSGSFTGFADSSSVSQWAKNGMLWATQKGIISGSISGGKTYLKPRDGATRAEAATMMKKYLELK
ncbi:MAG: S-layer homology domain-containing protein, partial [Clostridia bacterium]|nr:S-layer homology domain-containing protein [Clostridia bacterium]